MKKILYLLLTLCLLLGILPSQALAYVGDILPSTGSTVTTETRADGIMRCDSDSGKKLIKSMVLRTADRQGMC